MRPGRVRLSAPRPALHTREAGEAKTGFEFSFSFACFFFVFFLGGCDVSVCGRVLDIGGVGGKGYRVTFKASVRN